MGPFPLRKASPVGIRGDQHQLWDKDTKTDSELADNQGHGFQQGKGTSDQFSILQDHIANRQEFAWH